MHDKEHERQLLLTYHQLIPPFSAVTPSKPQVSMCFIITFVFRIIMYDDPSFQEQSVCIKRNMKQISNVSAMNTFIERFVSVNVYIVEHLHSFKHAHYIVHPVYTNNNFDYT